MKFEFKRKFIQLTTALIYNANLKGFPTGEIYQGKLKGACVPGLNCYSCPGAIGSCPLGSLQVANMKLGDKLPYYVLGMLMVFGIVFGRIICGFLCPFGLIQELLHKIPSSKLKKNKITKLLSNTKFLILVLFVFILPVILQTPAFCKYICPAGTIEASFPLLAKNESLRLLTGTLFSLKVSVAVIIVISCVFVYRAFCRFLCPLGAIYALFSKVSVFGITVNHDNCTYCNKCIKVCPMDISEVGDRECIQCGKCMSSCNFDAIYWRGPKISKREDVANEN